MMIRAARPVLSLLLAMVFAISSIGWSSASARLAAAPAKAAHHMAPANAANSGDNHHGSHAASAAAGCADTDASCSKDEADDETSASCCAMACHLAIEALAPGMPYDAVMRDAERSLAAPGRPMTMADRLDRPPRPVGATAG